MGMQPWCELNQYPHEYKTGEVNGADYVEWQVPEADLSWLMLQYGGEFQQDPYHDEPPYMPTNWTHILGK